ncbi:hypothetical protein BZA05DRAFT_192709 [Tricharina praecox]|uniref:uncharacterized protein n=1 Tax=Tricharina praecox TaxID=43433 RepID=UPI0022212AA5|nr:uncharacterized protein BZA05DRAFT_192709 [Tricharina praecox]KAI5842359.1 hypothetical protein BZA05DRAFT_192709 [Tricharina praecox]
MAEVDCRGGFSHDLSVNANDLLKACQNLLVLDKDLDVFRFAYLSVDEYVETRLRKIDSHTQIARACPSLLCSSDSWIDYDRTSLTSEGQYLGRHFLIYSAVFWLWHFGHCEDEMLTPLWDSFMSEANYQRWREYHGRRVMWRPARSMFWKRTIEIHRVRNNVLASV